MNIWRTIGAHIVDLVDLMLPLKKGDGVDIFCDPTGTKLAFASPSGTANIKLCRVTAPNLADCYDVHPSGSDFVNGDGEKIPKAQLPAYLVQSIVSMRDEGAEWGWEFKVEEDG